MVYNAAFYQTTKNNSYLWNDLKKVPKDGTVITQNHIAYIFAHQGAYLFPDHMYYINRVNQTYIVVDFRDGQNPNNYFPLGEENMRNMIKQLVDQGKYKEYYHEGSFYIYKKVH
jgi:hypothetical protein